MNDNQKLGLIICLSIMVGFASAVLLQQAGILNRFGSSHELVALQDQTVASPVTVQPQAPVQVAAAQPIDVGNKFCPVTHRQIGLMGPGVQEVYNGKIYHLCCGGCISTFESDPEKYSKIAEGEAKG
jgi:YHS domain-containing protein